MEKFEVIVVGAGLSGLAAALPWQVRGGGGGPGAGGLSGAKNVTGGRLYVNPVRDLFPEIWDRAPLERFVAGRDFAFGQGSIAGPGYSGQELADLPPQSWTVLRARFDRGSRMRPRPVGR
jgi:electron transfer flavoprotein-quinone oxidoreductase